MRIALVGKYVQLAGRLQVGHRGARARRLSTTAASVEVELGRLREARPRRDRGSAASCRRHPDPRRLRRARDRGQDPAARDRPRAGHPVPRASASACRSRSSSSPATSPAWTAPTRPSSTPRRPYPVIDLLPEQKEVTDLGGTMRLGADPVKLHEGTRAREIYGEAVIYERHRHRYEVNNQPAQAGSRPRAWSSAAPRPDERLVEIVELPDHPFFVASQFHPEFKSRPTAPAAAVPRVRRRGLSTHAPSRTPDEAASHPRATRATPARSRPSTPTARTSPPPAASEPLRPAPAMLSLRRGTVVVDRARRRWRARDRAPGRRG